MKLLAGVLAIFAVRDAVLAIVAPPVDGDLWWQRWLGQAVLRWHRLPTTVGTESFVAQGHPWVPQEWLFGVGTALAFGRPAWPLFAGFVTLCAVAALAIVAARALARGASPAIAATAVACAGLATLESFGVRAQVVAWPLFAALLWAYETDGPLMWLAVPIVAVWANVHASVMAAPAIAAVLALGAWLDERAWTARVRRHVALVPALLAATTLTPLGIALPRYALELFASPFKAYIREWQPSNLGDFSFLAGVLPLLVIVVALGRWNPRRRWRDTLLAVTMAALAFDAVRNVSIAAIALAPIAADALAAWERDRVRPSTTRMSRLVSALGVASFAYAALLGVVLTRTYLAPAAPAMPVAQIAALDRSGRPARLFCADFAWCSAALGSANVRDFLDGRADPFPLPVWKDFAAIEFLSPRWNATLDRYRIDAVIVAPDAPLDQALARTPGWHLASADTKHHLWRRSALSLRRRTDLART